jgi:hypothetical protein
MLSNLSTMATELAKASAQLTGDAQEQVLASATDVAKQVSDIVGKSLQTPEPPAPSPAPTPSPSNQQEKAEVSREAKRIDQGGGSPKQKEELKKTIGAAVTPDDKRDYQMAIKFLDIDGIPYTTGSFEFTLALSLFELGLVVDINGGAPIPLSPEGFFFPERFTLTKGRKITLSLVAIIGTTLVPGSVDVVLSDQADISFECRMKFETRDEQATTVKGGSRPDCRYEWLRPRARRPAGTSLEHRGEVPVPDRTGKRGWHSQDRHRLQGQLQQFDDHHYRRHDHYNDRDHIQGHHPTQRVGHRREVTSLPLRLLDGLVGQR